MIGKKLLNQDPVSLSEVKEIIEKRKKEGELSYEQNLTLEYCKKFSKLSKKDTDAILKDFEPIENVNKKYAIILSDVMPKDAEEVKLVFAKEHFILSDEEIQKILDVLNKHRK